MPPHPTSLPCRLAALVLGALLAASSQAQTDDPLVEKALAIHHRVLTLDTHVDIAGAKYATEELDPGVDHPDLRCDLVKMERGGMDGVFLVVYTGQGARDAGGYRSAMDSAMEKFDAIRRLTTRMYPDRCELATSPDDVRRITAAGKRAIMIGVENGYPIGTDLANVARFYDLGARYITLSHNGHNQICDSCNPRESLGDKESEHGGLSPFGREVVAEMNRLGMMVDVSHISRQSCWDVVEVSTTPIIASHSGCRAVNDHARNLDDKQIEALAASGGVLQIVALDVFLKTPCAQRLKAMRDLGEKVGVSVGEYGPRLRSATDEQREQFAEGMIPIDDAYPPTCLSDFVDHIDHAVQVAGIEHVGIGSDFDGGAGIVDFESHADAPNVTVELVRRGYSESEIRKIWGGNLLRVWRRVEETAD